MTSNVLLLVIAAGVVVTALCALDCANALRKLTDLLESRYGREEEAE